MKYQAICLLLSITISCDCIRIKNITHWWGKAAKVDALCHGIDGIYRAAQRYQIRPSQFLYTKNSENSTKWISATKWRFHRDDINDAQMHFYENINLVLSGMDAVGVALVNRQPVGQFINMFVQYVYDAKPFYRNEYNDVSLEITPSTAISNKWYRAQKLINRLYPECPPDSYNGDCYVFMLRKMQASFGTSFGPSVPSMGVWKQAYIEGFNETVIRHVVYDIKETYEDWELDVSVYFANNKKKHIEGVVTFTLLTTVWTVHISLTPNEYDEMVYSRTLSIPKLDVETWWPNGYGKQTLYNLDVTFTSVNKMETDSKNVRVGFRKIELIQDNLDSGSTFYFKVNDLPIFIKGAVMVPVSLQPELGQDKDAIYKIFSVARDQHMNMIRIWGGGVYESDNLYDLADEMGLLIWQDFAFTDYSYPASDDDYLSNVVDEVRHQLKRLRRHPSIAIFSSNDEGELALSENRYGTDKNKEIYSSNYIKLTDTIKKEFLRVTNNKGILVPSSPSNAKKSNENNISQDPNSPYYGDAHFFNYDNGSFDSAHYPTPRFCSAYGFQSIPNAESFLEDTDNTSDLTIDSEFMVSRQHFPDGYQLMQKMIEYELELPDESDWQAYNDAFVYYSQIVQAVSMKVQTEHYRSYRNRKNADGSGYTMGALYWQLNDVWTAPTWSGRDYFGRWKMLQYFVYDFFHPIIITGELNTSNNITSLDLYVITDVDSINGATASLQVSRWNGLWAINETKVSVALDSGSSKQIYRIDNIDKYLSDSGCSKEDCFFFLKLENNGKAIAPENFVLPAKLRDSNLVQPNVKVSLQKLPFKEIYEIIVTTDKNAPFVWLDAHTVKGYFSDNGFLQVTTTKKVFFYSEVVTSEEELRSVLTVTHLRDQKYFTQ